MNFSIPIPTPDTGGVSRYYWHVEIKVLGLFKIKKTVEFWVNLSTRKMGAKLL